MLKYLQHGKRAPWLLTTNQTFQVFAALFACNLALLLAIVHGTLEHKGALESIARTAELARLSEAENEKKTPPPPVVIAPPATIPDARASGLQISLPVGWKWRGCRASDTGDSVEILLGQ